MNRKILILTVTLFAIMCIIWNCTMPAGDFAPKKRSTGGGGINLPAGPLNPNESDVVLLNRHMTNYLLYGTKILDSTLVKYENILQSYGDTGDTDVKRVINAQLTPSLTSESNLENAFNYTAFNNFKNINLYTKSTESGFVPLCEVPVTQVGEFNSEKLKNEIHGKIYALKESLKNNAPKTTATDTINSITGQIGNFFTNFDPTAQKVKDFLISLSDDKTKVKAIQNTFNFISGFVDSLEGIWKSISWACPVVGFFIDLFSPSQNQQVIDAMQENFDIVFQYLDGIVDYLQVIEQKIDQIHGIVLDLGYSINMNALSEIRNELNSTLSLTGSAGLTDQERAEYIRFFNTKIDTLILNYIIYIEGTYDYYKRRYLLDEANGGAGMKDEMKDYKISIDLPVNEKISYLMKQGDLDGRISLEYYNDSENPSPLPNFSFADGGTAVEKKILHLEYAIPNPDRYCPYDPAMIRYLHEILLARFQMNSFWKKDINLLNEFNKDRADWLLTNNYSIPLVKNKLSNAFEIMRDIENNINSEIDSDAASIQEYIQILNNKDWEFSVTKKSENHTKIDYDSDNNPYTIGGNFDVYYHTPNRLKNFSTESFYAREDSPVVLGYRLKSSSNSAYDVSSISSIQQPLSIDNPYKYVMVTSYQYSAENSSNYYLGMSVYPGTPIETLTKPQVSSFYPKYFSYMYYSYSDDPEYWRLYASCSPSKLPVKIVHEPDKAVVTITKPDGTNVVSETNLTIGEFNIAEKIKMLADEAYKARGTNMFQVLSELIAMEVDLNCYINDPENTSY